MLDDAGHPIGKQFGEVATDKNLFPQDRNFNRGAYNKHFEDLKARSQEGKTVDVEVRFEYDPASGTPNRPTGVSVGSSVDGGPKSWKHFRNAPGGK